MKKMNLGVCFGIIIAVVCLFFQTGYAATYYVSNSGNDRRPGHSENTTWKTIFKVNSYVFSDGDTILFKRGDTFSDRALEIKNVNNLTIGDYGEGEKPLFDGNKIQPIRISNSKNVTIRNIDISGQEWQTYPSSNMVIKNVEGLILDGVFANGHTRKAKSEGKTAIFIDNCSGVIEIKNCEIFNWGPYDLPKTGTDDFMGIALTNMETGEYKIHDNKIYNINSDGIHVSLTQANGAIHNNILYNAGADAIGIKGSENCEIFENEFYRTVEFLGEGGKGSGGLPAYINLDQVEGHFSRNNTVSANNFRDGDSVAIKLGNAENTRIYENKFSNVKSALYIQDMVKNTSFHHNIIENPQSRMTSSNIDAGCIFEDNSDSGTQIYNNTIYNEQGNCKHLIALANSNETLISNNIVYQNYSSEDAFGLYYNSGAADPVISNNYWYNPGKINRTMYSNKIYTANMQEDWNEKHPGDKFGNPLMNDPEEGDYSLYETSLKIGAVYDETEDTVAETDESGSETDDTAVVTDDSVAETDDSTAIIDDSVIAADDTVDTTNFLYVDNNHLSANDENSGTESEPFKTVQKGIESAKAGDTVYIKSGTYDLANFSKTIDKPLILMGEDKNSVIIENCSEIVTTSNSLTVKRMTFKNSGKAIFNLFASEGQTINGIDINNCTFKNTPFVIKVTEETAGNVTNANILDNEFLDINNRKVKVVNFENGIVSNINILNNTFKNLISTGGGCIAIFVGSNATRNTTKDIDIDGNYMDTIEGPTTVVDGAGTEVHGILAYGANIRISNNIIKNLNPGQDHEAIYMKGSNSQIINNTVENCGSGFGGADIAIKGDEQLNNIISGNTVISDKAGRGMLLASGDSIVENNYVEKTNGEAGIQVYSLGKSVQIKSNHVKTKANSISLYDAVVGSISDNVLISFEGKTINIKDSQNIETYNNKECQGYDCQ